MTDTIHPADELAEGQRRRPSQFTAAQLELLRMDDEAAVRGEYEMILDPGVVSALLDELRAARAAADRAEADADRLAEAVKSATLRSGEATTNERIALRLHDEAVKNR